MKEMLENLWIRIGTVMVAPRDIVRRQEGQTLTEYALILAVLSLGLVVALGTTRDKISSFMTDVSNAL